MLPELLDYRKNHNHDFLLDYIEIPIIKTIIFELENMMYLFSMSPKKNVVTENFEISHKMVSPLKI